MPSSGFSSIPSFCWCFLTSSFFSFRANASSLRGPAPPLSCSGFPPVQTSTPNFCAARVFRASPTDIGIAVIPKQTISANLLRIAVFPESGRNRKTNRSPQKSEKKKISTRYGQLTRSPRKLCMRGKGTYNSERPISFCESPTTVLRRLFVYTWALTTSAGDCLSFRLQAGHQNRKGSEGKQVVRLEGHGEIERTPRLRNERLPISAAANSRSITS